MQHQAGAPILVLSPHLDDAVLSAWGVLSSPGPVAVLNVFAGVPDRGPVPRWDRMCGAEDVRVHMRARLEEDRAALALAGRTPACLDFLDGHYRDDALDPGRLRDAIAAAVPTASLIYAPAGIGLHRDHLAVRDAAFELGLRGGVPLRLYADLPYAVRFGWPSWVTREPADPALRVDADWDAALTTVPVDRPALRASPRRLDEAEAAAKLEALRRYRTQFAALNHGPVGLLEHPLVLPYEVEFAAWSPTSARSSGAAIAAQS